MDFRGAFCDMRADSRASGKEYVVKGEGEQFVADFRSGSLHYGDFILFENACDKRFKERGDVRRLVTGLRYNHVPGGNGCDDGRDE